MSRDTRIGLASVLLALFGIAAFYLWPNQKWIGWTCLACCLILAAWWVVLECKGAIKKKRQNSQYKHDFPVTAESSVVGFIDTTTGEQRSEYHSHVIDNRPFARNQNDGPDVILAYDNQTFGGLLAVRNFGPGVIYNVTVVGIRYGDFMAQFDPIAEVEAKGSDGKDDGIRHFNSPDNTATKKQLIDAVSQSPESENFDWSKVIPVTLQFDWKNVRHEYRYELECWPFRNKVEFRRKMVS